MYMTEIYLIVKRCHYHGAISLLSRGCLLCYLLSQECIYYIVAIASYFESPLHNASFLFVVILKLAPSVSSMGNLTCIVTTHGQAWLQFVH